MSSSRDSRGDPRFRPPSTLHSGHPPPSTLHSGHPPASSSDLSIPLDSPGFPPIVATDSAVPNHHSSSSTPSTDHPFPSTAISSPPPCSLLHSPPSAQAPTSRSPFPSPPLLLSPLMRLPPPSTAPPPSLFPCPSEPPRHPTTLFVDPQASALPTGCPPGLRPSASLADLASSSAMEPAGQPGPLHSPIPALTSGHSASGQIPQEDIPLLQADIPPSSSSPHPSSSTPTPQQPASSIPSTNHQPSSSSHIPSTSTSIAPPSLQYYPASSSLPESIHSAGAVSP